MTAVRVDESPPTLLPEGEPVTPPPPPPNGSGDPAAPPPPPAYSEAWVRKAITLACNALAAEFGDEMRATELELSLLAPALAALLSAHAPAINTGDNPTASAVFVAAMVILMGARRGLAIRRRGSRPGAARPRAPQTAPSASQNPTSESPASPAGGGAFGDRPVVMGGKLGNGTI